MSTPSTPTSPPPEPFEIKPVTYNDEELVQTHLRKTFYREEPLNFHIKLVEDGPCIELEQFATSSLKDNISIMAITPSGQIAGLSLNAIERRDVPKKATELHHPKFSKIGKFLGYIDKQGDVFGKFPDVEKVLNVKILSVDGAWRGRGVAKQLLDRTREIAREQGCQLMRVDCSSHFSARAMASLGFDCVYELKYADYKENGKPIFSPEDPHNEAKIYVQRITSGN